MTLPLTRRAVAAVPVIRRCGDSARDACPMADPEWEAAMCLVGNLLTAGPMEMAKPAAYLERLLVDLEPHGITGRSLAGVVPGLSEAGAGVLATAADRMLNDSPKKAPMPRAEPAREEREAVESDATPSTNGTRLMTGTVSERLAAEILRRGIDPAGLIPRTVKEELAAAVGTTFKCISSTLPEVRRRMAAGTKAPAPAERPEPVAADPVVEEAEPEHVEATLEPAEPEPAEQPEPAAWLVPYQPPAPPPAPTLPPLNEKERQAALDLASGKTCYLDRYSPERRHAILVRAAALCERALE